jgi:hypothetical protein
MGALSPTQGNQVKKSNIRRPKMRLQEDHNLHLMDWTVRARKADVAAYNGIMRQIGDWQVDKTLRKMQKEATARTMRTARHAISL